MKKSILLFSTLIGCYACGFLDEEPVHFLSVETQFAEEKNVEFAVNRCYSFLPDGYLSTGGAFTDAATEDAVFCKNSGGIVDMARSQISSQNPVVDTWSRSYSGISQTLLVDENLKFMMVPLQPSASTDMVTYMEERRKMYRAEVRMIRAYFYFDLLRHFGGVPLIDRFLEPTDKVSDFKRADFAQVVEEIVSLCNDAISMYPSMFNAVYGKWGKGAAMAIKAKTLAYAASDLYNREVENPLLGYVSGSQDTRIEQAIEALHDVIASGEFALSKSYNTFNAAPNIANANINIRKEWIVYKGRPKSSAFERSVFPPSLGGQGTLYPSQDFVDVFDNLDGSEYVPGSKEGAAQWENRDPRLEACIVRNGGTVRRGLRVYTYRGDGETLDGIAVVPQQSTLTGYYLKKCASYTIDFDKTNPGTTYHMNPLIRYADILLLYAEMMNAKYGPDIKDKYTLSAREALTEVRKRAGLKNPVADAADATEFTARVKKERRVELCFEDQRFYDLRRWKDAPDRLNGDVHGIHIKKSGDTYSYELIVADDTRRFEDKMYFFPIPYSDEANGMEQNPGW